MDAKTRGVQGEELVANHYQENGYVVLNKNYKTRFGEIDIIVKNDETLVFVEVKTRENDTFATPAEAVDLQKQQRIIKTAQAYLTQNRLSDPIMRFDVAEVLLSDDEDDEAKITVIEGAF